MNNSQRFNGLIDDYLKKDNKYELQINNFRQFLKDRLLEEKVFNLNETHIDDYFIYSFNTKIGAVPTLVTHISALKSLFDYLISKEIKFTELKGYISTPDFKDNLSSKLVKTFSKPILDNSLLTSTLFKIDNYINGNIYHNNFSDAKKRRFMEIMIARVYIKLSLVMPLKISKMLEVALGDICNSDSRTITYNGIIIKLPNSLRQQIVQTIEYAQDTFNLNYEIDDKLFVYLYKCTNRKADSSTISSSLTKTYSELKIREMLKQKAGGKKDKYIYPAECYKKTAILSMLQNGTNIVFLKQLTDLDIGTLVSDYDFEEKASPKDIVSIDINNGIISTDYYTYI
jgi:hypothetical protein